MSRILGDPQVPLIYAGDFSSVGSLAGGGVSPMEWASDSYTTDAGGILGKTTFCAYAIPPGGRIGSFYYGDNLGRIFAEDETGTVAFSGYSLIVPAHYLFSEPGGDRSHDEGKKLVRMWSYVVSEDSSWIVRVWPGDEFSYVPDGSLNQVLEAAPAGFANYVVPGVLDSVAASRDEAQLAYNNILRLVRKQPRTVHSHDTSGVPNSGRGFTFEYIMIDPVNALFFGLGGVREPGTVGRPPSLVTAVP